MVHLLLEMRQLLPITCTYQIPRSDSRIFPTIIPHLFFKSLNVACMKQIELNKSRLQFSKEKMANLTGGEVHSAHNAAVAPGGNQGQEQNAAASTETVLLCLLSRIEHCIS
jgi:hypothetical protein